MAPGGSRMPAGGLEPAQEGFSVASSGLKSAPRWLGSSEVASSGLRSALRGSGTYHDSAQLKSGQLESAIYSFIHGLVLLYIHIYIYIYVCFRASFCFGRYIIIVVLIYG